MTSIAREWDLANRLFDLEQLHESLESELAGVHRALELEEAQLAECRGPLAACKDEAKGCPCRRELEFRESMASCATKQLREALAAELEERRGELEGMMEVLKPKVKEEDMELLRGVKAL